MEHENFFKKCLRDVARSAIESDIEESPIHNILNERQFSRLKKVVELNSVLSLNEKNRFGQTPLIRALEDNECPDEICLYLISCGADVNLKANDYRDPLLCALAYSRSAQVIEALLKRGCNAKKIYFDRSTLCIAIESCSIEVVQLLSERCPQNACLKHFTAVHCALDYSINNPPASFAEVLKILINLGVDLNCSNADSLMSSVTKRYSLCYAFANNVDNDHIKLLIEGGAMVDNCDRHPSSLFCAFLANRKITAELVQLLFDANASVSETDANGNSPLCTALLFREYETKAIRLILEKIEEEEDIVDKCNLLHAAVLNNKCKIGALQMLIERGGHLDTKRETDGEIPLHRAVRFCPLNVIAFLVEKGSPLNVRNKEGKTPLYMVLADMHDSDVVKLLFIAGAQITEDLLEIALKRYVILEDESSLKCFHMMVYIIFLVLPDFGMESWICQQRAPEVLSSFVHECNNLLQYVSQKYGHRIVEYISGTVKDFKAEEITLLLKIVKRDPRIQHSMFCELISARIGRAAMILQLNQVKVVIENICLNFECKRRIVEFLHTDDDVLSFFLAFFNPE